MGKSFGFSVYVSSFNDQKAMLEKLAGTGSLIFTSLHISEEFNENYVRDVKEMCNWLNDKGFKIIADVSKRTLDMFEESNPITLAEQLGIDMLRIDYGFSLEEIKEIAKAKPIVLNASTINKEEVQEIKICGNKVYAMHNFYPRPETGLDEEFFRGLTDDLKDEEIETLVFVPGDEVLRRPIHEGLPTLEVHRGESPYVSYLDFVLNYNVPGVFVGDIKISEYELELIKEYISTGVITIPVNMNKEGEEFLNDNLTIRVDSGKYAYRIQESREYASKSGKSVKENNVLTRNKGCITIDNENYGRYEGEVQIIKENLKEDERVNVIGEISEKYIKILEVLKNGDKIKFIEA